MTDRTELERQIASGAETVVVTLLPCPFCGGEARLSSGYWFEGSWVWPTVRCQDRNCEAEKETKGTEAEAIAAWNTRATQSDALAVMREAEGWLRAIGTWLLETDNDMKLPDGVLDTDPEDIADNLRAVIARMGGV